MTSERCQAERKNGQPCQGKALPDSPFCFAHDDRYADLRRQGSSRGGKNKRTEARVQRLIPHDLRGLQRLLFQVIDNTYTGDLDPRKATAIATTATALLRIYEAGEFEQRLQALEVRSGSR